MKGGIFDNKNRAGALFLGTVFFFILQAHAAHAAFLYLQTSKKEYKVGDTFAVNIRIDPEGECLNAFAIEIGYQNAFLRASEFSRGESILTLWPEPPSIDNDIGTASFAGGLPGGYCGRIPGDPELTNLLGTLYLTVPPEVDAGLLPRSFRVVILPGTQALLSDGLGTAAALRTQSADITIIPRKENEPLTNELYETLAEDAIPPEPFTVEIQKNESIFNNRYFIVFSTVDKQSGLDRYEVMETDEKGYAPNSYRKAVWNRTESPYLLEDQYLQSTIKVKAVDNAGNERIVEFTPPEELRNAQKKTLIQPKSTILLTGGLIALALVAWHLYEKRRKRKNPAASAS